MDPTRATATDPRPSAPGPVRAMVAVGGAPARWYRSLNEARHDADDLAATAKPGDVLRAWLHAATGPPDYELRVTARHSLRWARCPQPAGSHGGAAMAPGTV